MAHRGGYDVVVDVDAEGDLGHTDLNDDLEFHNSTFDSAPNGRGTSKPRLPPDQSAAFLHPASTRGGGGGPSTSTRYLWSLAFYQQFFDVDTSQILHRCRAALFPRQNFLDVLEGNPDLYGPFWVATTVVVILFLTGTISAYLAEKGQGHFAYDFRLLSGAAGLVYGYTILVPAGLWGVLKWFGAESAGLVECWCLYGYSNLIWVPVALVSWSPLTALNYAFTGIGFALSATFLFRNLYPVVSATDHKTSRVLLGVVLVLHAGLAIAIKILFFAHHSPAAKTSTAGGGTGKAPNPIGDSSSAGDAMMFF